MQDKAKAKSAEAKLSTESSSVPSKDDPVVRELRAKQSQCVGTIGATSTDDEKTPADIPPTRRRSSRGVSPTPPVVTDTKAEASAVMSPSKNSKRNTAESAKTTKATPTTLPTTEELRKAGLDEASLSRSESCDSRKSRSLIVAHDSAVPVMNTALSKARASSPSHPIVMLLGTSVTPPVTTSAKVVKDTAKEMVNAIKKELHEGDPDI